ncbi:unnamed protein product [Didymodactylos carnosus]|uniref:Major facilitator superfamily (MFS) profile domain-containing protein n=1 Tax=Didymodactylos carnosus TaxID=1234261 RepID=A0A814UEU1_9BILA|nr:unnamed protein product [Didymodactylos carnosus]CAF1174796.1 unnamed protein product [Didymodactylos carnosus]CAF3692153.1 unnamed protein product [Didymodactylos carnosus]CAF3938701.1 unnamed protein product [Didymodactylos carnosus]
MSVQKVDNPQTDDTVDSTVKNVLNISSRVKGLHKSQDNNKKEVIDNNVESVVKNHLNGQPIQIVPSLNEDEDKSTQSSPFYDKEKDMIEDGLIHEQSAIFDEFLPNASDLELLIKQCGEFGCFQWTHFFFLLLLATCGGACSFYYVFAVALPQYRCQLPNAVWPNDHFHPQNETHANLIHQWIPNNEFSNCFMYTSSFDNHLPIKCLNWTYDQGTYGYTFTEEQNLVCSDGPKRSLIAVAMSFGLTFVILTGRLSDSIGRKKTVTIGLSLFIVFSIITQTILQLRILNEKYQFILLFVNQLLTGVTCTYFTAAYILIMELSTSKYSSWGASLFLIGYTLGEIIVACLAWIVKDWLLLKWSITIYAALISLPYFYFMPESPRWLYDKQRWPQLQQLLRRIAKANGRKDEMWLSSCPTANIPKERSTSNTVSIAQAKSCTQELYLLFTNRGAVKRLFVCCLISFITLLLFFKIGYGLGTLKINPYISVIVGAVVEALGYFTGGYLIKKIGRKATLIIFLSITAICILTTIHINNRWNVFIISQLGKFTISAAVFNTWVWTPELHPTPIRGTGTAIVESMGRVGALLAPVIDATSTRKSHQQITAYIYSMMAVIVAILSFTLPETKGRPLPESFEEIEQWKKEKSVVVSH